MIHLPREQCPCFLIGFAFRDVAQDDGGEAFLPHHCLGDGGLYGKLLAIGAKTADSSQRAHSPPGFAGLAKMADMPFMRSPVAFGDEAGNGLPQRVIALDAKHRFGGRIEKDDLVIIVDRDDRVHRGRHNGFQTVLSLYRSGECRRVVDKVLMHHRPLEIEARVQTSPRAFEACIRPLILSTAFFFRIFDNLGTDQKISAGIAIMPADGEIMIS